MYVLWWRIMKNLLRYARRSFRRLFDQPNASMTTPHCPRHLHHPPGIGLCFQEEAPWASTTGLLALVAPDLSDGNGKARPWKRRSIPLAAQCLDCHDLRRPAARNLVNTTNDFHCLARSLHKWLGASSYHREGGSAVGENRLCRVLRMC